MNALASLRILALAAVAALPIGCAHETPRHDTLRLALTSEPPGFDPLVSDNANLQFLVPLVYGFLLGTDARGRFTPDLVTRVPSLANGDLARDGRTIRYRLRRGVRWHDGAPFDARDVTFSFRAARDPRNDVPDRSGFDDIASVTSPGPFEVDVRLKRPYSPALATFFSDGANDPYPILPAHLLAGLANLNAATYNGAPVGLGPYRFVSWSRGSRMRFEADPHFRRGAPKIARIDVQFVPDNNTQLTLWQSNALDALFVHGFGASRATLDEARRVRDAREYLFDHYQFNYVMFQTARGPLADARVREAIVRGIDRDAILRDVRGEFRRPGDGDRLPGQFAYDPTIREAPYDPAGAARSLDAAGWRRGSDGMRRDAAGDVLTLEIVGVTGSSASERFDVQLQAALAALGIRANVRAYQYSLLFASANDGGIYANGKFDLAYFGWQPGEDADHSYLFRCDTRPPRGENYGRICDPVIDREAAREMTSSDPEIQADADRAILRELDRRSDLLFLGFDREAIFAKRTLAGVEPAVLGNHFWNVERWRLTAP